MEIVFDRQIRAGPQRRTRGEFKTKVVDRGAEVTVNAFYKHSRIKQYVRHEAHRHIPDSAGRNLEEHSWA